MPTESEVPSSEKLMAPTVVALRELGGSGHISDINERIIEAENLSEEQLSSRMKTGVSKIEYRLAWARTYLKYIGVVANPSRAVWSLTEKGLAVDEKQVHYEMSNWRTALRERRRLPQNEQSKDSEESESNSGLDSEWREALLRRLLDMKPSSFERLIQRLLREAGFHNMVLDRSGDGGLDGVGVHRISLVSSRIYFQCKRWRNPVGPKEVRDFRGAMSGRGEQGLLISTASFTQDARREATRDGAPLVDLVDGTDLCELLKQYGLGVKVEMVEDVSIDAAFFDQF